MTLPIEELIPKLEGYARRYPAPEQDEQFVFWLGEHVFPPRFTKGASLHIEMPDETRGAIAGQGPILYTSPHRSWWETAGMAYPILEAGGAIPYIAVGSNVKDNLLVKTLDILTLGQLSKYLGKAGMFFVRREKARSYSSTHSILGPAFELLSKGEAVAAWPTDGRNKNGRTPPFRPTVYQAATAASAKSGQPVILIPYNTDYAWIRESKALAKAAKGTRAQKVGTRLLLSFLAPVDDVYISYAAPITVTPNDDPKELAARAREKSLDRVKILPANVVAAAYLGLLDKGMPSAGEPMLLYAIEKTRESLLPHEDRWRGFSAEDSPRDILEATRLKRYLKPGQKMLHALYKGPIEHYLDRP